MDYKIFAVAREEGVRILNSLQHNIEGGGVGSRFMLPFMSCLFEILLNKKAVSKKPDTKVEFHYRYSGIPPSQ